MNKSTTYFHIYIDSDLTIDELANQIRNITNCNISNKTKGQVDQQREGANMGGIYYLFELIGLEINLIKNEGEVFHEYFEEYEYYAFIKQAQDIEVELFKSCVCYLGALFQVSGIPNKVIEF